MINFSNIADRSALPRRVLLLLTSQTYRAQAFINSAKDLDIEVIKAINMDRRLAEYWDYSLGLEFSQTEKTVKTIVDFSKSVPLGAIISVDDSASLIAAQASEALNLPHNSPKAAVAARDKYEMRQLLAENYVPSPNFRIFQFGDKESDINYLEKIGLKLTYPCVIKPLSLSGSRGVIRVDDPDDFVGAGTRLRQLLTSLIQDNGSLKFLVEDYISGFEVAIEGIMNDGNLKVLAMFDKPDPLEGPYFEETIYITPSRLPIESQEKILNCVWQATKALGLEQGPIHAELRINEDGPWVIEVAGRSIGGLCSQTLRFGTNVPLEELILRQAFGMEIDSFNRENQAGGVMMIPIPKPGLLRNVAGCDEARAIPLIEKVEITTQKNHLLTPLPEGDSYLGFIFARGHSPNAVENSLRKAHQKLRFEIEPIIQLVDNR